MRHTDNLKDTEKELGRYKKKVEDQKTELQKLRQVLKNDEKIITAQRIAFDAWIVTIALQYGVHAMDEDTGESLGGIRLTVPEIDTGILKRYEMRSRKENGEIIFGILPKEEKNSDL